MRAEAEPALPESNHADAGEVARDGSAPSASKKSSRAGASQPPVPDLQCVLSPSASLKIIETVSLPNGGTEDNVFSYVNGPTGSLYGGRLASDGFARNMRLLKHDEARALLTPILDALEADARGAPCAAAAAKIRIEWRCAVSSGDQLLAEPRAPSTFAVEAASCGSHSLASTLRRAVESLEENPGLPR
ncbi:hypothetical protein [Nannocystis pusilla]|uniref:hypothetical protein n=1 Tax=Nannocystis pusilla TaxID=889268 RepID=UPI003DA39CC1